MRILVTGATGFVGRSLVLRLQRDGHEVVAFVRNVDRARSQLGAGVELFPAQASKDELVACMSACEAVINLAGAPLISPRWKASSREAIISSRVGLTRRLVEAMHAASPRPAVFVSGSAVGAYGDRGDEELQETSAPGDDFLAKLCLDWEASALEAEQDGVRVVCMRIGVVLGREGGALGQMLLPFRMGIGGPIGGGRPWVSWIHLNDLIEMFVVALTSDTYRGIYNATAPNPETNGQLTRQLAGQVGLPALLPVPSFGLRLLFGIAADVILASQRVLPARALEAGFPFRFKELGAALADLVPAPGVDIRPTSPATPAPMDSGPYLTDRPPRCVLQTTTTLDAPLEEVFPFFASASNLGLLTPPRMAFRITSSPEQMADGALIDYTLRLGPVPLRWRTRIEQWSPGSHFVDSQVRGPYTCWWHEHHFREEGDQTVMEDRVYFRAPFGPLGALAERLFIRGELGRIFSYRADAIRFRYGQGSQS